MLLALLLHLSLAPASIPLVGRDGMGHACSTTKGIYTAAHVVEHIVNYQGNERHIPKVYNTPYGVTKTLTVNHVLDLATIELEGAPWIEIATGFESGDKVYWYEFEFNDVGRFMSERKREAKVLRVVARHIFLDKSPKPGASGACLFNEEEQVLGIMVWSLRVGQGSRFVGAAISLIEE